MKKEFTSEEWFTGSQILDLTVQFLSAIDKSRYMSICRPMIVTRNDIDFQYCSFDIYGFLGAPWFVGRGYGEEEGTGDIIFGATDRDDDFHMLPGQIERKSCNRIISLDGELMTNICGSHHLLPPEAIHLHRRQGGNQAEYNKDLAWAFAYHLNWYMV